jgi:hypothetical protein
MFRNNTSINIKPQGAVTKWENYGLQNHAVKIHEATSCMRQYDKISKLNKV